MLDAIEQAVGRNVGDFAGDHRGVAILEGGELDARTLIELHVVKLFGPDVRLDHQPGVRRHDLGDRVARAHHRTRGSELELDHRAARRCGHHLARGGVFGFAHLLLDLADPRGEISLQLIARRLDVGVLKGLNLQIALAQTLPGARELRAPLLQLARVVDHHRLDLRDAAG